MARRVVLVVDEAALNAVLEAAEIRRNQWHGVSQDFAPITLIGELYEADSKEAGSLAANLTGAIDLIRSAERK